MLSKTDRDPALTPPSLEAMIMSGEYAALFLADDAIKDLLTRVIKHEQGCFPLAERRDATVRIEISSDDMTALATTRQAYGGEPLTTESIAEVLQKNDVQAQLIDEAAVKRIVLDKVVNKVPLANGQLPVPGVDATFTYLFETESNDAPVADEIGNIDLYNLRDFLVVDENTPLLQREPATLGVQGTTVKGKVLKVKNGNDASFAKDTSGAIPDPENYLRTACLADAARGNRVPVRRHHGGRRWTGHYDHGKADPRCGALGGSRSHCCRGTGNHGAADHYQPADRPNHSPFGHHNRHDSWRYQGKHHPR